MKTEFSNTSVNLRAGVYLRMDEPTREEFIGKQA